MQTTPQSPTEAIRLENLCKSFGPVQANRNICLTVNRGEILALLGENGSGKTTMVNMLSGIYKPDSGRIFLNGKPVSIRSPREAIAMGIDKQGFVSALLDGHGVSGNGAFPDGFATFGGENVTTETYDPEGAKAVLEAAGWIDSDGDGIREKDGVRLTIRWLTYPSRQELPLLAESAQATLKDIGIDVDINCTANRREFLADMTSWDIYASAMVTAPSGDPQYFFTSCCAPGMSYNFGAYENADVNAMIDELATEFDTEKRGELAVKLQQTILDDNAYVFCSFLQMNMISKSTVTGYTAHACDYYQVTADLDING